MSYTAGVEFSERCCGKRWAVLSDKSLLSLVRINEEDREIGITFMRVLVPLAGRRFITDAEAT